MLGVDESNPKVPFACGYASIELGMRDTSLCLAKLTKMLEQIEPYGDANRVKQIQIMVLELTALSSSNSDAIKKMQMATSIEEAMSPPSGPPEILKPSHELLGEILLKANRPNEAIHAFKTALARQPNRARSLIGLARAIAQTDDRKAATAAYEDFLRVWFQADSSLPEVKEARDYLANNRAAR
jgi:hypothetical protein